MQASRSESQARIKRLVDYLLGDAAMTDGVQDAAGEGELLASDGRPGPVLTGISLTPAAL
jgi:hypothetical protein